MDFKALPFPANPKTKPWLAQAVTPPQENHPFSFQWQA
jgi:hypothetical protein